MQVDQHKVRRHEAPDDGLTEDDGVIGKLRDEEEHEHDLAHQLNDTGEEGQDLLPQALQGVAGGQQDTQHRVEGRVPEQIPCTVFQHHRLVGARDELHHPLCAQLH